jgi:hypothetical protein
VVGRLVSGHKVIVFVRIPKDADKVRGENVSPSVGLRETEAIVRKANGTRQK